ncbi:MAG: hypothetical protein Q9172_001092 [Xanthocarpia lactea]
MTNPSCLRALFPTPSPAVYSSNGAFCATYTTSINTITTNFPSRASTACGTAPARYSSACSCKPTISSTLATTTSTSSTPTCSTPPTPATNNIVKNGGFECGLAPWIATDSSGSIHSITQPGDAASNAAYQFNPGPTSEETFLHPANIKQNLTALTVGAEYVLRFRTYFGQCARLTNYIRVFVGRWEVTMVDSCENVVGRYADNGAGFVAGAESGELVFEFVSTDVLATTRIDGVVVVRV